MALHTRYSAIVLTAIFVAGWLVADAEARGFRMQKLPNVPAGCNTCHTSGGGTPRNSFGLAMEALVTPDGREVFWGPELAALDSDGDGFTNGQELGDPEGTWGRAMRRRGMPTKLPIPGTPTVTRPKSIRRPR